MIDEIAVGESDGGRGIGRQLVLAAMEECRRLGCCELEVSTEKTNAAEMKLYRKWRLEDRGVPLKADL